MANIGSIDSLLQHNAARAIIGPNVPTGAMKEELDTLFFATLLKFTHIFETSGKGPRLGSIDASSGIFLEQFAHQMAAQHQVGLGEMMLDSINQ